MHRLKPDGAPVLRAALADAERRSESLRFAHRLHAVLLVAMGCSCYQVGRWYEQDPRTVERWVRRFERDGVVALHEVAATRHDAALSPAQRAELALVLHQPASDDVQAWTGKRVALHLLQRWNVSMGERQCQRLLKSIRSERPGMRQAAVVRR